MTMRTPVFDYRKLTPGDWDQLAMAEIHLRSRSAKYSEAWNTARRLTGMDPESPEYARVVRSRIRPATRQRAWLALASEALKTQAPDVEAMKTTLRAHFG